MSSSDSSTINLTIDGKAISVQKGTTVYSAIKQLGIEIPIFCYHDRMPPFGACRVCLVEVENMARPQTSCTLEVANGMVVKTQSQMAVEERNQILEFLLLNHPLDCPICDRGGECPLQEHVFAHGPGLSRFFEEKRRFKKPLPLGPVLMLDRERCIVCARCTRFADLIAGDNALELLDRGFKTEVGTPDQGPAESKFIGNTIMICPVGALTSQVYRFRARPWDNEPTNSTCTLCPVGCSMVIDSRDGQVMRIRSREDKEVNDIWLCDKGWFGYEFTYHPDRLKKPLVRKGEELVPIEWKDAISLIVSKLQAAKPSGKIAGIGGNPLTVEENYYFQKLIREGAGVNHVDSRVGTPIFDQDEIIPGMALSIADCENLSYAILFGLDLTEDFPVIWLRLKQAILKGAKVIFFGHYAPEIARHLSDVILHPPGKEIETLQKYSSEIQKLAESGGKGAIFIGRQYLNQLDRNSIFSEITNLSKRLLNSTVNVMDGFNNSYGARMAGMLPDKSPLDKKIENHGLDTLSILESASSDGWDFLYVAGANPAIKYPSNFWKNARSKLKFLVVNELFLTETAAEADLVLPTLSYIEKGGSFVNIEGKIQTLMPGKEIPENIYSDGEIFAMIAQKLNLSLSFNQEFANQLKSEKYSFKQSNLNVIAVKKSYSPPPSNSLYATFTHLLFDNGVRMKHDPHVFWLAKEPRARIHPDEGKAKNIQDNEKVRLYLNGNVIEAKIQLDDQVALHTIVLPLGFDELPVHELCKNLINGTIIDIQKSEFKA